jgi:hypothetical protein
MNGKEKGELELDASSGMLKKSIRTMILSGICKIGATDVLQKVNRICMISGKKIN